MFTEITLYDRQGTTCHPLGTLGNPQGHAGSTGSRSGDHAGTLTNTGTPIRDVESLDGINALSDEDAESSRCRDEFARARLQPEARHEHPGHQATNSGDSGIGPVFALQNRRNQYSTDVYMAATNKLTSTVW